MPDQSPRLSVRAVIMRAGRLLIVNAYPGDRSDLWCAPGGGVERHASLADNLIREVAEETGLTITPGRLLGTSEFHDPAHDYHQVELFYAATAEGEVRVDDPEGVVNRHLWVDEVALRALRFKPDFLPRLAFGQPGEVLHDPLERIMP
ncbi:NUDIX hydrolase [Roseobacter sp. HKCCA0434]|uniref:NUDIX hydrolase n=1 Tax=Roseobacter sp. HKCCA0434 TaxID=3079297 RepID=UPI002905E532|nr:NUDIX hydrolase [Roseobacter sp. HKCCA0434]